VPAALISILSGALVGLWNGLLINLFNVNFFVATLSSWTLFQGVGLTIGGGDTVYGQSEGFEVLGNGGIYFGSFRLGFAFLIFILIAVLLYIMLKYTRLGRNIYARGGNPETAHLAGINIKFTYTMAYVIMGACAGVAGMLLASRMSSASPMVGLETNLIGIAAAVLGGSSLFGGKGGVVGTVAGVFFLSILENVMSLLAVDAYYQYIIRGCVLVAVVLIDVFYEGKNRKTASILKMEEDTAPVDIATT
jgi:ribose transport system permease protein